MNVYFSSPSLLTLTKAQSQTPRISASLRFAGNNLETATTAKPKKANPIATSIIQGFHQLRSRGEVNGRGYYFAGLATQYEKEGRLSDLIWAKTQQVKQFDSPANAKRSLGLDFFDWGKTQLGLVQRSPKNLFERALKKAASNGTDFMQKAIETFEEALALKPNDGEIISRITDVYLEQGNWAAAEQSANRSIAADKNAPEGYMDKASLLIRKGQMKEALEVCRTAAKVPVQDHAENIGVFCFDNRTHDPGFSELALQLLSLKTASYSAFTLKKLAILLEEAGRNEEAAQIGQKATAFEKEDALWRTRQEALGESTYPGDLSRQRRAADASYGHW